MWSVWLIALLVLANMKISETLTDQKLLVILLDGLRWDYLNNSLACPGFSKFIAEGVKAEYMSPVYPTESFPNYYSIMTGLYPESHKIIFNYMYDTTHKSFFAMLPNTSSEQPFWWDGAEPLWVTTTRNNISTASLQWPGANLPHNGTVPNIATPFVHSDIPVPIDFISDLNQAIQLLATDQVQYAQVYTEYTDFWGHALGPDIMKDVLIPTNICPLITKLLMDIKSNQLEDTLNVVIVSDHGMSATDFNSIRQIYLNDYLNVNMVDYMLDRGSHMSIYPTEGFFDEVYASLQQMNCVTIYKTNEIPVEFHINYPDRLPPILMQVNKGCYVHPINDPNKQVGTDLLQQNNIQIKPGFHGYVADNFPDMWGIFLARGPAFKKGAVVPHFKTIDAYNMLAYLVGVTALPNNGTWDYVKGMLA